jgi:hypothetical protein
MKKVKLAAIALRKFDDNTMKLKTDMNNKHTPGPWIYDETWGLIHDARKSAQGPHESAAEICAIHAGRTGKRDESKANARLIAAAPELLAALQTMVEQAGCYMDDGEATKEEMNAMDAARAAIAKAKGTP